MERNELSSPKQRILVVDNDTDYLELIDLLLADNFITNFASSGPEAIKIFKEYDFDLVLLDVGLTLLNGKEVCRAIKKLTIGRFVPVILVSGYADPEAIVEGFAYGADDYLTKPFDHEELLARCNAMLKIKDLQDRLVTSERKILQSHSELEKLVEQQVNEIKRANRLKRYVSPSMVKYIGGYHEMNSFGDIPVRKVVTTFFTDIRNFTQYSDQMDPENTKIILDNYFDFITEIACEYRGTINKFLGDGILMIFGDPVCDEDHTLSAMKAAIAIKNRLPQLQEKILRITENPMQIGMGIHTGPVVIGNIGSLDHLDYTVVGAAVNLAARLQGFSTNSEIIVTDSTIEPYKERVQVTNEKIVPVKGYEHPISIAEVTGVDEVKLNQLFC